MAAPGELDPSFGQRGYVAVQANKACLRVCLELAGSDADALALQPDGGIVVGGYNSYIGAPYDPNEVPGAIIRLHSNGTLDTSFGEAGGIDNTPFGVDDIQTNTDGGLLVTGEPGKRGVGAQRYTPEGLLDGSYGSGGTRWLPAYESERRDGSGRFLSFATIQIHRTDFDAGTTRLDVTRRLPSGRRDLHFGHRGYAKLPDTRGATSVALAAESDGSVIAAFSPEEQATPTKSSQLFLEHLTPTGEFDRAFGQHGIVKLRFDGEANGIRLTTHNGHLFLLAGERRGTLGPREQLALILAEFTDEGHLVHGFGKAGIARTRFATDRLRIGVSPHALIFDAHGDAIVVGSLRIVTVDTPAGDGFLARYTSHGRDCSFGAGGVVVDTRFRSVNAVALQPNGRIVVAGSGGGFLTARYLGSGKPRTCPRESA